MAKKLIYNLLDGIQMGPRMVLFLLLILVMAVNIITLLIRKKKFLRLEGMVVDLTKTHGGALTLEEISSALGVSLHDARMLMRKSVTKGTAKEEIKEGKRIYSLNENQG